MAGKQKGYCSSTARVPWECGVSAPHMNPQSRATEKGGGALCSIRQWESVGSRPNWETHTAPSQTRSDFFVTPAWEICSIEDYWSGQATELRDGRGVCLAHPTVTQTGSLFSGRTLGRELDGAGLCALGKRIGLAHLKRTGNTPPTTCRAPKSAPSCDPRQRGAVLG